MKQSQMIAIKQCRQNRLDFLSISQQIALTNLLGSSIDESCDLSKQGFHSLCDKIIALYKSGDIKNKIASKAFEILSEANTSFRTESHRFDNNKIFEYSESAGSYVFLKHGTQKEFYAMNHYID